VLAAVLGAVLAQSLFAHSPGLDLSNPPTSPVSPCSSSSAPA